MLDQLGRADRALSTLSVPRRTSRSRSRTLLQDQQPGAANLKLSATNDISLGEVYPAQLPDLFHGSQLVVLGRLQRQGPAAIS